MFQQISATEDLLRYFGFPTNQTRLRIACTLIRENLSSNSEDWSGVVRSYDNLGVRIGLPAEPYPFPGISAWFLGAENNDLPQCANCGSFSAVLKFCRGCGTTW